MSVFFTYLSEESALVVSERLQMDGVPHHIERVDGHWERDTNSRIEYRAPMLLLVHSKFESYLVDGEVSKLDGLLWWIAGSRGTECRRQDDHLLFRSGDTSVVLPLRDV